MRWRHGPLRCSLMHDVPKCDQAEPQLVLMADNNSGYGKSNSDGMINLLMETVLENAVIQAGILLSESGKLREIGSVADQCVSNGSLSRDTALR
jgi:hypothetical protein